MRTLQPHNVSPSGLCQRWQLGMWCGGHARRCTGAVTWAVLPRNHLQASPGFPSRLPNLVFKILLAPRFQVQAQRGTGWFGKAKAVGALLCHSQKYAFFWLDFHGAALLFGNEGTCFDTSNPWVLQRHSVFPVISCTFLCPRSHPSPT